eukprot:3983873-Heterocapsa_arctica.AAC.1
MSSDRNRAPPESARDSKVIPGPKPSEMNHLISAWSYRPPADARVFATAMRHCGTCGPVGKDGTLISSFSL